MFRRLCSEQPADGGEGGAPASSDSSQETTDSQDPAGDADKPGDDKPGSDDAGAEAEKIDGSGKEEGKDKPDSGKDKKPDGAPEKYEFQSGEGQELDQEALKEFEPIARDLNLTNEQAQKLVDVYGSKILAGVQQRQVEAWTKQTEDWAATVKADKEIGGDKLTANLGVAQRAIDTFGSPELKEYLNTTGLGNNPELVRFCVKVGKSMSEDSMVTAGNSGQRSAADVLYGKN